MGIPSSVTRFGKNEPFDLQVSRNQIYDHKVIFKFGFNPDIKGTEEPIWEAAKMAADTLIKKYQSKADSNLTN